MVKPTLPDSARDFTPADPNKKKTLAEIFAPAPEPPTELGKYRPLSTYAGVHVSPLCLGTMSLGNQWNAAMGSGLDVDDAFAYLDAYYEAGGNFIDTANSYQFEQAEMIIGEWMESRQIRDEIVISTKYSSYGLDKKDNGGFKGIKANYVGNQKKNLLLTIDTALKKLRTDYIDLFYVHWWDYMSSVEEIMQSLNEVVKSGKVHYLGICNAPAWIVARANEYARQHGLAQFTVYQGQWNVGSRDIERDIVPMCRAYGMTLAPYWVLGGGKFKSPEELQAPDKKFRGGAPVMERDIKIATALQEVAEELGENYSGANVALAWTRHMMADCIPVIGGTSIENLKSNVKALEITLTEAQVNKVSNAVPFDWGFPYTYHGRDPHYLPGGKPNALHLYTVTPLKVTQMP
ncbi:hypothetical protein IAT38_008358 [Cryptococcus sp. DSM 104549]